MNDRSIEYINFFLFHVKKNTSILEDCINLIYKCKFY